MGAEGALIIIKKIILSKVCPRFVQGLSKVCPRFAQGLWIFWWFPVVYVAACILFGLYCVLFFGRSCFFFCILSYFGSVFSLRRWCMSSYCMLLIARVAKLVDALDLGSSRVTCESSSLSSRINVMKYRDLRLWR